MDVSHVVGVQRVSPTARLPHDRISHLGVVKTESVAEPVSRDLLDVTVAPAFVLVEMSVPAQRLAWEPRAGKDVAEPRGVAVIEGFAVAMVSTHKADSDVLATRNLPKRQRSDRGPPTKRDYNCFPGLGWRNIGGEVVESVGRIGIVPFGPLKNREESRVSLA